MNDFILEGLDKCKRCKLHEYRINNEYFTVGGRFNPDNYITDNISIMFIGREPGENEAYQGVPFVGRSGQLLQKYIDKYFGKYPYYITNLVKCRTQNNRPHTLEEREACSAYFEKELKLIKPFLIVALGNDVRKEFGLTRNGDFKSIEYKGIDIRVVSIWHPSYVLRPPFEEKHKKYEQWFSLIHEYIRGNNRW